MQKADMRTTRGNVRFQEQRRRGHPSIKQRADRDAFHPEDEAVLPNFSALNHPTEGGNAVDDRISWSFDRLLTPTLQVSVDGAWIHRSLPSAQASGFDATDIGIKGEIFRNNEHEALVSAGVAWGIGQSGAVAVGANEPNSVRPGFFFGNGFGDLPDWLSWARPFAITGAIVDQLPV
jgi:hypothetical protein